ncbi:hypothetical protein Acsp03_39190 [Actinomadura sp. NBRC 104412]|nr:hypothetical protein Acsp03_39190 [Actinomadura sp. NBRC 104412]
MRVIPRRRKGRRGPQDTAPVPTPVPPASSASLASSEPAGAVAAVPDAEAGGEPEATRTLDPADWSSPDARRRARSAERQRAAAELKRSRAALRRSTLRQDRAVRDHRSSLLIMVIMLGLLIATVVVSGGLVAASMRNRPITLAAPLHIYPVVRTVPGQCPAGTAGISGQTPGGPACYQLTRGIAIRRVADLGVQRAQRAGAYDVAVTLRSNDRRAFAALTRASLHRDLAFVVRDRLVTVPRVDAPILNGKVVITGPRNRAEADRLVTSLRGR